MIKINIISVGKIKESYIRDGIAEFAKRLSKYANFNVLEIQEEDDNKGVDIAIKKESEKIKEVMLKKKCTYNILLDIKGNIISSEYMANKLEQLSQTCSEINFIIGGSNGVSTEIKELVDYKISFSHFTFPHQLMRLILSEQIYRWVSINKNIKYHK